MDNINWKKNVTVWLIKGSIIELLAHPCPPHHLHRHELKPSESQGSRNSPHPAPKAF